MVSLMIQQTTLDAYILLQPKLNKLQEKVYNALSIYDMTNLELSEHLNMPINCITPRVNELRKKGLIREKGYKIQKTNRKAILWGI